MGRIVAAGLAIALLAAPAGAFPASSGPTSSGPTSSGDPVVGLWINPHRSVAVRNQSCGNSLCGRIVWASSDAQADARDSGVSNLIGIDLLRDYRPKGARAWQGTVLVPDMGHRFSSEIDVLDPDHIRISGCILHGLLCKLQVWMRIGELPK
ncbi:MAG: DUF2147 domain-containing protein [Novosphingobium sp.]|nr:DUF2147 domain-containing protein [Novosphingobium sp.]